MPRPDDVRALLGAPTRVAISVAAHDRPNLMAHVRGNVVEVVDGDRGWEIIDRLAQRDIGQPYPLREDRVAYLVEPERAFVQSF
jgi:hypothetical protein